MSQWGSSGRAAQRGKRWLTGVPEEPEQQKMAGRPWVRLACVLGVSAGLALIGLSGRPDVAPGDRIARQAELRPGTHSKSAEGVSRGPLQVTTLELDGQPVEVAAGQVLVEARHEGAAREALRALHAPILRESSSGYWRVGLPAGTRLEAFLTRLQGLEAFASAQPEGVLRSAGNSQNNREEQATPANAGESARLAWNLEQINLSPVLGEKDLAKESLPQVVVAVIDSGLAYEERQVGDVRYEDSEDLKHSTILPGPDFVDGDGHPNDLSGHGTHVANVLAADGESQGVAPRVTLMPIRVLDGQNAGVELDLVDGIAAALDAGVDLINLSLSFPPGYTPGPAMEEVIERAAAEDVLVVASSGNSGLSVVPYPGAYGQVLCVGASRLSQGDDGWIADYSNLGPELDIVAPGGAINLDVNGDGKPDAIEAETITPGDPSSLHHYYMAGTSQAVAHVVGAAAWLRAAGADAVSMRQVLVNTARETWGNQSYATLQGVGLLDVAGAFNSLKMGVTAAQLGQQYYVNVLPILSANDGRLGAVGMIRVLDSRGAPAVNVQVIGRWLGAVPVSFAVYTNAEGLGYVSTASEVPADASAIFGLEVDRLLDGSTQGLPPLPFLTLSHGLWNALDAWMDDPVLQGGSLVFQVLPGQNGMPEWAAPSFLVRPMGPDQASRPVAVAFTPSYLPALMDVQSIPARATTFASPLHFGWGDATMVTVRITDDIPLKGDARGRLIIAPYDPALFSHTLTPAMPLANLSSSIFASGNQSWWNQLILDPGYEAIFRNVLSNPVPVISVTDVMVSDATASTLVSDATASTLVSDATASTLVSDATASTLVSDATASTLVSDATASTLVSDATASTLVSDATASTLVSDATASTLISDAMASTLISDATASTLISDATASTLISDAMASTLVSDAMASTLISDSVSVEVMGLTAGFPVTVASSHTDAPTGAPVPVETAAAPTAVDVVYVTPDL